MAQTLDTPSTPPQYSSGCLLRVGWTLVAIVVQMVCVVIIFTGRHRFGSLVDGVFWGATLAQLTFRCIALRFLDKTEDGDAPATGKTLCNCAVFIVAPSSIFWLAAHLAVTVF